jgi:hypothetical protein
MAGIDADAARIDPDGGAGGGGALAAVAGTLLRWAFAASSGGSGGGIDGGAGGAGGTGTDGLEPRAGPGIPRRVRFMSIAGFAATCDPEPGGGGGTGALVLGVLFFPRPSKMSRSEPPLFSSDIRVS